MNQALSRSPRTDGLPEDALQEFELPQQHKHHKSTTHDERYVHLVGVQWPGGFMIGEYFASKYRGGTAFCRKEDDGCWYVTVALCWAVDEFTKKRGRQNARRHYFANRTKYCGSKNDCLGFNFDYNAVLKIVVRRIAASEQNYKERQS